MLRFHTIATALTLISAISNISFGMTVNGKVSEHEPKISFDHIINLGGDCQVAYQLYIHGLRKYALPFDSLITPCDALCKMLEQRFEGFMAQDNFELKTDEQGQKYILDKKYQTRLLHDFKCEPDFIKDYQEIATKYLRRVERIVSLIVTAQYPLFIRKNISKEQAKILVSLLIKMRTSKPFLLVLVDESDEIKSDWKLPEIRNFYLKQPHPYHWKGDAEAWKSLFLSLDLDISTTRASSDER